MDSDLAQQFFLQGASADSVESDEEQPARSPRAPKATGTRSSARVAVELDDSDDNVFVKADVDKGTSGHGRGRGRGRGRGTAAALRARPEPSEVIVLDDDEEDVDIAPAGRKRQRAQASKAPVHASEATSPEAMAEEFLESLGVRDVKPRKQSKRNDDAADAAGADAAARLKSEKADLKKKMQEAMNSADHVLTASVDELRLTIADEQGAGEGQVAPEDLGAFVLVKAQFPPSSGIKPTTVKLRMRQPFSVMLEALADKRQLQVGSLRMRYEGALVSATQTPQQLDMSADGDNVVDFEIVAVPPAPARAAAVPPVPARAAAAVAAPAPVAAAATATAAQVKLDVVIRFPGSAPALKPTKLILFADTAFDRALKALAGKLGTTVDRVRLTFRGAMVDPRSTPAAVGMSADTDCTIDAVAV